MSKVHRIFKIDVGNLPPQKAQEIIDKFKKEVSKKPENYFDYFIPVKKNGDSGVEIIETEF